MTDILENNLKRIRMVNGEISIVNFPDLILYGLSNILNSRNLVKCYNMLLHWNPMLPKLTFMLDVNNLSGAKS